MCFSFNSCQDLCLMTHDINSLHVSYIYTYYTLYIHSYIHKSIDSQHPVAIWQYLESEVGERGGEGWRWRSEFTAFNIGKMKYDRGRRASKEPPFCGIDKFILLPRFVGGWYNCAYRCDRAYLSRSFPNVLILLNTRFGSTCTIASIRRV